MCWSILHINKIGIYEYWCDNAKPKYGDKIKLRYGSIYFIAHLKWEDIFADLVGDVDRISGTLIHRNMRVIDLYPRRNKVVGLMQNEMRGRRIK